MLHDHPGTELFRQSAVNYAALCAGEIGGGNAASLRVIEQWLPIVPGELQATLWCDMALYAGRARKIGEARRCLDHAHALLPQSVEAERMAAHYYPMSYSRVLTGIGRSVEALDWLPPLPDESRPATMRFANLCMWIEALLAAGEKDTAERYMNEMQRQIAISPLPRFQRKWETLSARF